jgi:hypothetical protein
MPNLQNLEKFFTIITHPRAIVNKNLSPPGPAQIADKTVQI